MTFIQAANFTPAQRTRVDLVVLHSTESPEHPMGAENVARWFAGESAPKASAHYVVDSDSIVQCVAEKDIAWAAPGANANGIQVEMVGYAGQTSSSWADPYSLAVINRTVDLVAELCKRWNIPPVLIGPSLLLERARGVTTHAFVSRAFRRSSHTDPGIHFPLEHVLLRVAHRLKSLQEVAV